MALEQNLSNWSLILYQKLIKRWVLEGFCVYVMLHELQEPKWQDNDVIL